jgi:quercetin dioxygenase-like cupin family protein
MNRPTRKTVAIAAGMGALMLAGVLLAQAPGITRTIVARQDISVPGREGVVAMAEIAPGGTAGWHTHPGDKMSYVMEGDFELMIAGKPPKQYKPGEGFVIPAGTVHNARNFGKGPARIVGVYAVDKDKPLASPAPAPAQ